MLDHPPQRLVVERAELHHAAAADERGVHLEVGVLRRRAHEDDGTVLDGVEEGVLLAAVEAVDLVDEKNRAAALREQAALGGLDLATEVLDRAGDGADLDELGVRGMRDDAREGCLSRAGGAIEDDGAQRVVLDRAPQPRPGAHGLLLAEVAIEGTRAHAGRERRVVVAPGGLYVGEQGIHGNDCTTSSAWRAPGRLPMCAK